MPDLICPKCAAPIAADDTNMGSDLAQCRACGTTHSFADLVASSELASIDLDAPPRGAWHREDADEITIGASYRSIFMGLPFLLFGVVWCTLWYPFVVNSIQDLISAILSKAAPIGTAPSMVVSPPTMGSTLSSVLFAILAVIIGVGAIGVFCIIMFGVVRIKVALTHAVVFEGIGPIGRRQIFDPTQIRHIFVRTTYDGNSEYPCTNTQIVIDGAQEISFGWGLPEKRMEYLLSSLRSLLLLSDSD